MREVGKGKVRRIFDVGDGNWVLVATDAISAFDVVLPSTIPFKGEVLTRMSAFWFDFTDLIVPNHMISINNADMPEFFQKEEFKNRCMLVKRLNMFPIECIVRGYITGSGWENYKKNGTVCDIELPKGLRESEKLPVPIFTPTTKAKQGHDQPISYNETVRRFGFDFATQMKETSIRLYSNCAEYARKKGIIIADAKFEFGYDENGELILADEILTPDSSRFWPASEYQAGHSQKSFDKQYLRDWLKANGWTGTSPAPTLPEHVVFVTSNKYIEAYETLVGKKF